MASLLSGHNIIGRYNLTQPRVALLVLVLYGKNARPRPLSLAHFSGLCLQGAVLRDEVIFPSGIKSRLAVKDVNFPRPISCGCDADMHCVHLAPLHGPLLDLGMWGTHRNMLTVLILLTVLLAPRK